MTRSCDVVVIGAGIIGAAVAYRLSESGRSVVVIDLASSPGAGTTGASSAIVRFHYRSLDTMALAWDSYHAWTDWADELGGVDPSGMARFNRTGGLLLGESTDFGPMVSNFERLGIAYEHFDAAGLKKRFPGLDPSRFGPPVRLDDPSFFDEPDGMLEGLYTPQAGYVNDPRLAASNYAWAAGQNGAELLLGRRVTAVEVQDGRVNGVLLDGTDRIDASVVVNAAGPASDELLVSLGIAHRHAVRSRPLRTETHVAPAPTDFRDGEATFVIDHDLGSAFRPDIGDQIHLSNVEPVCDHLEWLDDPWDYSDLPTPEIYETQLMRVARRLPSLALPPGVRGLGSAYDVTPDWQPLLDKSDLAGLYLACGTSGNSFKTAPTIAHVITTLIEWTDAGNDHDIRAAPFTCPRTGAAIDLGVYSRNRQAASSSNVIA